MCPSRWGCRSGLSRSSEYSRELTAGFRVKEFTWYQYLFTQFRSIWLYLRLYVFPFGQNGDYDVQVSRTIIDQGALFGLIGLLALGWPCVESTVVSIRWPRSDIFGFLILLAPTSSVVPIRDVAVERRLYLPFICLLFITVDFLRRWKTSRSGDDRRYDCRVARGRCGNISAQPGVGQRARLLAGITARRVPQCTCMVSTRLCPVAGTAVPAIGYQL